MSDPEITERLTREINAAVRERKHILWLVISGGDYLKLTGKTPEDGAMGRFLGVQMRLGEPTHVHVRKAVRDL